MLKSTSLSLAGSCLFLLGSLAQGADDYLTLSNALHTAIGSHPSVASKKEELSAASSGLESAKWNRFPGLSGQTTADQTGGTSSSLRLEQPLWTGGRIHADIDANSAKVDGAKAAIDEAGQSILVRTASAFLETIRLQSRIAAAQENLDEHQRLLDLITRRNDNQISATSEVTMARARLQQAKNELLQLKNLAVNAKADLEQLYGQPIKELKVPKPLKQNFPNLETVIEAVLAYSPKLRQQSADMQSADATVRSRKASLWPQLSARYEHFWGNGTSSSNNNTTYLALAYQPGNGLSSLSAVREAESRKNAVLSARENTHRDVIDAVRADWNQMHSAAAEVSILRELVESSRNVYESFTRQYSTGRKTWIDVLNARREAIQARNQLADTEWGGVLAGIRISIATGTVLEDIDANVTLTP